MKQITLNEAEDVVEKDWLSVHDESIVDFDTEIGEQPIAIKCGEYWIGEESFPLPFGSFGDFSCIVGPSKTMKTVIKNAIIACCIGGNSNKYFDNFTGVDLKDKWILDLDTEQSKFHVKRNTKQIQKMVGTKYPHYKAFALRKKSVKERVSFLNWLVSESEYAGNIGIIVVDGAADLVSSVNNELECYALAELFMKTTADNEIHLITILHKNSQGNKPTGHLGSAIQKKAETVMWLSKSKKDGFVKATSRETRNEPFEDFEFKLNNEKIPVMDSCIESEVPY
jgi:hypothetical protein